MKMGKKKKMDGGKKRKPIVNTTTTTTDVDVDDKKASSPPWSDLPYELLERIKKKLFFIDQVYFRAVCKSWSCIERVEPLQQTPWLFIEDENDDDVNNSCKLVDSRGGKPYIINGKALKDKFNIKKFKPRLHLHESKFGWLLLSNCYKSPNRLVFYSPFLDESICFIDLPPILESINNNITYATFTSNPLDDEDCTVLALQKNNASDHNMIHIYTYRLRVGHASWTSKDYKCEFLPSKVERWMYVEGMLYYVTKNGRVGNFDLAREAWNVFPSLPAPMPIDPEQNLQYHLVKSDGEELFLILQCNLGRRMYDWWTYYSHYIYRLDMSSMIWEDLKSIGDRALFVGRGYNKFLNASVLKLNGERKRMSDMIYYTSYYRLNYCSAHEFTNRNPAADGRSRRHDCSRHYGPIVKKERSLMLLIDPPYSSSSSLLNRACITHEY